MMPFSDLASRTLNPFFMRSNLEALNENISTIHLKKAQAEMSVPPETAEPLKKRKKWAGHFYPAHF